MFRATLLAGSVVTALSPLSGAKAETISVAEMSRHTHIHGLAVDGKDPSKLLIATHHGLFRAGSDGKAERISEVQDFMGFNPHPNEAGTLYASGHPAKGGNLGFVASVDNGRTWKPISPGVDGPVDFHQMTVSPANPKTMYGAYDGNLQVSADAGKTWRIVGPAPEKLIDLAASAKDAKTVYAATEVGLLVSLDGGTTWKPLLKDLIVTLVEVTPAGSLYAFVVGRGLVRSTEGSTQFEILTDDIGGGFLIHLAADPGNPARLFGATQRGRVLGSKDQGRTWETFGSTSAVR